MWHVRQTTRVLRRRVAIIRTQAGFSARPMFVRFRKARMWWTSTCWRESHNSHVFARSRCSRSVRVFQTRGGWSSRVTSRFRLSGMPPHVATSAGLFGRSTVTCSPFYEPLGVWSSAPNRS